MTGHAGRFGSVVTAMVTPFRDDDHAVDLDGAQQLASWLVDNGSGLEIMKTSNADLPMKHGAKALLTIDVWEHAYYIDYRNLRPKFVETFLNSLVNWEFAQRNFG